MGTQSAAAGWIDENDRVFRPAAAVRLKRRALTDSLGQTRRLIVPGATKGNDSAANPVALLSSCRQPSACTSYCASKRPPRSSNRYPPRSSSKKPPPRLGAICPVAGGGEDPWITSLAGLVVLP